MGQWAFSAAGVITRSIKNHHSAIINQKAMENFRTENDALPNLIDD